MIIITVTLIIAAIIGFHYWMIYDIKRFDRRKTERRKGERREYE